VTSSPSTADVTGPARAPAISVVKSANPTVFTGPGQTIVYSYVVTNTGNVTLSSVSLDDSKLGPITNCTPALGPLAPGASTTCTATHTTTQADVMTGSITNKATVTGTAPGNISVTDSATATVEEPAISMVKSANPSMFTAAGQTITYAFKVSNIGATPLEHIAINDALPGLSPIVCQATSLAIASSTTCTATYITNAADVARGTLSNTATTTATDPNGVSASPSSSTSVIPLVVQPPPTPTPSTSPPTLVSPTLPSAPPAAVSPITPIPIQVTG
jgi:uncharacterized repeat protein (TIGR01451 family)